MVFGLSIYQLLIFFLAGYYIFRSFSAYIRKEKSKTFLKFATEIIIWGGVLIFSVKPTFVHKISDFFGMGENLNTLVFIGFILVFLMIFKVFSIIEKIENDITELVRAQAVEKFNTKKKQ